MKRNDRQHRRTVSRSLYPAAKRAYLHPATLATAGHADDKHFPRIEAALLVTDSRTGRTITLTGSDEVLIFRALSHYRDAKQCADTAHVIALIDSL